MFASRRQEKESQPHKAKSAIAHIAFLPTLTEKMKFETEIIEKKKK